MEESSLSQMERNELLSQKMGLQALLPPAALDSSRNTVGGFQSAFQTMGMVSSGTLPSSGSISNFSSFR